MTNQAKTIVDKMFDAFAKGNLDELVKLYQKIQYGFIKVRTEYLNQYLKEKKE